MVPVVLIERDLSLQFGLDTHQSQTTQDFLPGALEPREGNCRFPSLFERHLMHL